MGQKYERNLYKWQWNWISAPGKISSKEDTILVHSYIVAKGEIGNHICDFCPFHVSKISMLQIHQNLSACLKKVENFVTKGEIACF